MAVWRSWTSDGTSTSANDVWGYWSGTSTTATTTTSASTVYVWADWVNDYEETAEERAARVREALDAEASRQRVAELARRQVEQEAKRKEETARAAALLNEHLSETQRKQLKDKGEFEVEAESGKRYVIARGYAGNVYSLDDKRHKVAKHCIHPTESVPDYDCMLAQLCWLRWNESEFLKVANTTKIAA